MDWLIDLIKVIVPMGLLILLVYVLLRQVLSSREQSRLMEWRQERNQDSRRLKLNAYERLILYLERISLPEMIMRTSSSEMEAKTLFTGLLLSIQKEFEHNLTQQLYISENLWKIINLAKQDLAKLVTDTFHENINQTREEYINRLLKRYSVWQINPVEKAKSAIRQEAAVLI